MGGLSIWHWLIVLLIVVLVFGTKKLGNIGSDLGKAVRDFKRGLNEGEEAEKPATEQEKLKADKPEASTTAESTEKSTSDKPSGH